MTDELLNAMERVWSDVVRVSGMSHRLLLLMAFRDTGRLFAEVRRLRAELAEYRQRERMGCGHG